VNIPRPFRLIGFTALLLLIGLPVAAQTPSPKIDHFLRESMRSGNPTQKVIISVLPGYRAGIRQALEAHGDVIKSEHPLIDALAAEIHTGDVSELARHPWVLSVSADAAVSAGSDRDEKDGHRGNSEVDRTHSSRTPRSTLRETLGLPRDWTSTTPTGSTGIGVAIIDSGIAPSEDFRGRITGFYDFTRGGIPTAPLDDYGHGTHVAGLIGSSGALSDREFQGVAPDVHLVGLKVLDATGHGFTSNVIKALEYVTANRQFLNVQIVNLSLGHQIFEPASTDPLVRAVEKATAAGLIVVTAAGNFGENPVTGVPGYTGITSPGNAPSAITVGAAMTNDSVPRDDDQVASYSSRGPSWYDAYAKPDIIAPGHQLVSDTEVTSSLFNLLPGSHVRASNGRRMLALSGTSMAAAVTSGVVALILDQHNRAGYQGQQPLTTNLVKAMLEFSAIPVANADYLTQGAGEINAGGAIALASSIDNADGLDANWLRTSVPAFSRIGNHTVGWGERIIWGDKVLSGNLLFVNNSAWGANVAWGANIVWGTNVARVTADNIVWGTNLVWGTNIAWGTRLLGQRADDRNIVWGTNVAPATADNIVWGTNIVWDTLKGDNIVWGTSDGGDNIVWGTSDGGDNIVWGTSLLDNIVWGTANGGDNIVWGTANGGDNIVWGTTNDSGNTDQGADAVRRLATITGTRLGAVR
jgi:serine protease AprX